jgi:hypothetical protein
MEKLLQTNGSEGEIRKKEKLQNKTHYLMRVREKGRLIGTKDRQTDRERHTERDRESSRSDISDGQCQGI